MLLGSGTVCLEERILERDDWLKGLVIFILNLHYMVRRAYVLSCSRTALFLGCPYHSTLSGHNPYSSPDIVRKRGIIKLSRNLTYVTLRRINISSISSYSEHHYSQFRLYNQSRCSTKEGGIYIYIYRRNIYIYIYKPPPQRNHSSEDSIKHKESGCFFLGGGIYAKDQSAMMNKMIRCFRCHYNIINLEKNQKEDQDKGEMNVNSPRTIVQESS